LNDGRRANVALAGVEGIKYRRNFDDGRNPKPLPVIAVDEPTIGM